MEFNPSLFSDNYKMAFIDPNKLGSSNVSILNQTLLRDQHEVTDTPSPGEVSFRSAQDTDPQDYSETLRTKLATGDMYSGRQLSTRTFRGSDSLLEGFFATHGGMTTADILVVLGILVLIYYLCNKSRE